MNTQKNGILRDRLLAKGGILAGFLNVADGLAKQKRVLDLLERYRELQHLLPAVVSGRPRGQVHGGPSAGALIYDLRENKPAARLVKQINRLLKRYHFRRVVPLSLLVGRNEVARIETETTSVRSIPFSRRELTNWRALSATGGTCDEHTAVEKVIELAELGELDRLRKCAFCSYWFMASRTDRVYHEGCAAKQHRKERKDSGVSKEYQKWYRKYAPIKQRKSELEDKRDDGYHLSKAERGELRQATEETKRLKAEWKSILKRLKSLTDAGFRV